MSTNDMGGKVVSSRLQWFSLSFVRINSLLMRGCGGLLVCSGQHRDSSAGCPGKQFNQNKASTGEWSIPSYFSACERCQQRMTSFGWRGNSWFLRNQASRCQRQQNATAGLLTLAEHQASSLPELSDSGEAQGAVTLNDSMNGPRPFRAHCAAVSCFDTGTNTSLLHLAEGAWVQSPVSRGATPQRIWQLAACRDKSGCFFCPAAMAVTAARGSHGAGRMSVTAAPLTPLPLGPSVCLPVILSVTLPVWFLALGE